MERVNEPSKGLQIDKNGIWVKASADFDVTIHYPEDGNKAAFDAEQQSFWFQNRNCVIAKVIEKFSFSGGFVDVGGGNGFQVAALAEAFPSKELYLVEPGYNGCINARSRGVKNVYNMFSLDFPFSNFEIGAVGLFDVIEHLEDDVGIFSELQKSVSNETLYFVTVPAFQSLWSDVDEVSGHFRRYTKKSLASMAERAGLKVLFSSYFFSYLTVPMFFLRCAPYRLGRSRDTLEIMSKESSNHSSGSLDDLFRFFGSMETKFISTGKIPMGTSLIAVLTSMP